MERPKSDRVQLGAPRARRAGMLASISAIVFLATWAGSATLYILFSDDALKFLAARQVSITRSYETQIATLETEVERLRSVKLIEQERVDRAITEITRRQAAMEVRQSAIAALAAERTKTDTAPPETTGSVSPVPEARPANRPTPLSDTIILLGSGQRWAQLHSRPLPPPESTRGIDSNEDPRIAKLAANLHRLESAQSTTLNEIETEFDGRRRRIRKVLDELGVHPHRAVRSAAAFSSATASAAAATGGPFLPSARVPEEAFARQLHRIRSTAATVKALEREISTIPVRRPTIGEAEVTSSFGVRLDPFLRRPAMHTGIDFRAETGDPVVATAGGRVVAAERDGGYGLMIEIDHGNGVATRYAHLSATAVHAGATVEAGDVIGRAGSTGRSTGPHLHYEVRLLGEITDPQRFLRAGLRLHGGD